SSRKARASTAMRSGSKKSARNSAMSQAASACQARSSLRLTAVTMPMILAPEGFFVLSPTMPLKIIKVSHPDPKVFHLNSRRFGVSGIGWIAMVLVLAGCTVRADGVIADKVRTGKVRADSISENPDGSGGLFEPGQDRAILAAMDHLYRMEYAAADSALAGLPHGPARDYFRGLVEMNRFGDLGDTSALSRARSLWENLDRAHADPHVGFARAAHYPLNRGLSVL